MQSFSPIHWLILLIAWLAIMVVIVWPITIILKRMGFTRWWTLLFFVPFGSIVGLWILSQVRWPRLDSPSTLAKTFE